MYGFSVQRYNRGPYAQGQPTQGDQSPMTLRDRFRLGLSALDAYAQQQFGGPFFSLQPDQQDKLLTDIQNDTPKPFSATALNYQPFDQQPGSTPVDAAVQSGIGAAAFFQLLLQYTIAGFFSDPVHGGNQDLIGWKLIGFPGAHMDYADHILNYGQPFTGTFITLADDQLSMSGGI
jgi:gluconate 2-dehydrogenase gamma chain